MMLSRSYKQNRIASSVLKDCNLNRSFGSEKVKNTLVEIMAKNNINRDVSKLPDYQRRNILSSIKHSKLDLRSKKILQQHFGGENQMLGKGEIGKLDHSANAPMTLRSNFKFDYSDRKMNTAERNNLIVKAEDKISHNENSDSLKERLSRIQS